MSSDKLHNNRATSYATTEWRAAERLSGDKSVEQLTGDQVAEWPSGDKLQNK